MIDTEFSRKFLAGQIPTEQEWRDHLREAHRIDPGMTSRAYLDWFNDEGLNPYQVLASVVPMAAPARVMDLACGDGFLMNSLLPRLSPEGLAVGVDMSEGELNVARETQTDPRVSFIFGEASRLPFKGASFDYVLCHMALMLMHPLVPVLNEVVRVLKPGGLLAVVLPDLDSKSEPLKSVEEFTNRLIAEKYPARNKIRMSDARLHKRQETPELFAAGGFAKVEQDITFQIAKNLLAEEVWDFMAGRYFASMLPLEDREWLRAETLKYIQPQFAAGRVLYRFPMRLIVARKN